MTRLLSLLASNWRRLEPALHPRGAVRHKFESEPALRSGLFSAEQMESHGRTLALQHGLSPGFISDRLLRRLDENEEVLSECCKMFAAVTALSKFDQRITPAGEWLLDNYYLIEEQIRTARKHLPKDYSRELPQLEGGPSAGLPRVYDIALENISHGDGRLDIQLLSRFVTAYQDVTPLTLGELWAIPIMLRLAVIENLRRVAVRVTAAWRDHMLAIRWANRMVETAGRDRKSVVVAVAEMATSEPPLSSSFVAEFTRRLQRQNAALSLPLSWVEDTLFETGQSIDELVQQETQQQAADQVSISNSMTSLRLLSAVDWRAFVESLSKVESLLRRDPAGVYARMDFTSRDHYRHVVERLARHSGRPETEVAGWAIELARNAGAESASEGVTDPHPRSHVGYYLADAGRPVLERLVEERAGQPLGRRLPYQVRALLRRAPLSLYLGCGLAVSGLLVWPFAVSLHRDGIHGLLLALFALVALLAVSETAIRLVNWVVTRLARPGFVPRLDYSNGLPAGARTVVVVPAMLGRPEDVEDLLDKLEVRYLGNRDPRIQFGLLTDFRDAPRECMEGDGQLLELAARGIEALNRRYPEAGSDRFFLCHRPRLWNEQERIWMGHERKRGKLCDFNELLRGRGRGRFMLLVGDAVSDEPAKDADPIRYVITLDSDTQLPRGAAGELVGAMSHILNRPTFDPARKRVVSGYGILQPRVGISLPSAERTGYSRMYSGEAGIDPYTRTVSDVYQDLFREGSFIGKGIYDVDAVELCAGTRFPENRILSHDLIEGCCARSGLLSDVLLYEGYPSCYSAEVSRRHRWIRGDWQILPWILPLVPLQDGSRGRNPFSALSRWKMFDNLRRSLVPAALLALLLSGWLGSEHPVGWTLGVLLLVLGLPLLSCLLQLVRRPPDLSWRRNFRSSVGTLRRQVLLELLNLAWLPHEVLYSLDAVVRTLWRTLVSGRHLLQWSPSHDAERACFQPLSGLYRMMWICPALAVVTAALLLQAPLALLVSVPFLLAWIAAPGLAWRLSRPAGRKVFVPDPLQRRFLRVLARRIWAFFDHHVNEEDNWLPPDNIQEKPVAVVAHRTSPTNIGLSLLAHLAAWDFGYLSAGRLLERLEKTLTSVSRLERYRNHLYNWYDTRTLEPLAPRYISTVDSGNLAGHLLTLRPGLLALADRPIFCGSMLEGLLDASEALGTGLLEDGLDCRALRAFQTELDTARQQGCSTLKQAEACLDRLQELLEDVERSCHPLEEGESAFWLRALGVQCRDMREQLRLFLLPPDFTRASDIPCWRELADLDPASIPVSFPEEERQRILEVRRIAKERIALAERLAERCAELADMDFGFLYDTRRDLLSIGFNLDEGRLDASYYDLLASEARLTYFLGIAQGQLPEESWFTTGRLLTNVEGSPVLLSWSGSMFEYLMPLLVMPDYEGSLLDETCRGAVRRQIEYGLRSAPAWGISESCYNMLDAHLNYQYRAFGAPGLGLKPGLGEDLVLAPYASALALMVAPAEACANLQQFVAQGAAGRYGMYEAVDYTPSRLPRGHTSAVIRSFMSHHQGMSLLAVDNLLHGGIMQRRFLSVPQFQATELLLQERVPRTAPDFFNASATIVMNTADASARAAENKLRVFSDPDIPRPAVQLLSNGQYHVMVSSAGGGYSRYRDLALTRWREDATRDSWGQFCYLRDVASGDFWSVAYQPTLRRPEHFEAIFSDARAEFRVREHGFDAHTEIVVSPEDDIELRRLRISNRGRARRTIEITSYAEVVLAPPMADAQHPAFSNLFVETELMRPLQAILCTRRPRSKTETRWWLCHLLAVHGADIDAISYETDRNRFIGRGRSLENPAAMDPGHKNLSGSAGAVLDPIVSIRCRITLEPEQTATVDLVTGVSDSREGCIGQIDKFRDRRLADRVFDLAWTHSQVLLHQLNASLRDARLYQQMASSIVYATAALRAESAVLSANTRGQNGLWGQSISGDLPIVLLKIGDSANIILAAQVVKAHAYWRIKGLAVDLVIWNEERVSYRQYLQDLILGLLPSGGEGHPLERPGGIFVRSAQQLSREDRILLQTAARLIVSDTGGTLSEQIYRRRADPPLPRLMPICAPPSKSLPGAPRPIREDLILSNPHGGFAPDGREYVITLAGEENVPAPWVNVLANPGFGSIVSESGSAYTWLENAHEFRLTPWENDPVCDSCGEAFYLRDEENCRCWSPAPLPIRGDGAYTVRHGFGYSVFEHVEDGICSELRVLVAPDAPVKLSVLTLRNDSGRGRRLSVTGYVEWVLGDLRSRTAMHVVVEPDPASGALFARNAYSTDFPGRIAFFAVDAAECSFTCDRREFLGRNGSMAAPAALGRVGLSGRSGAGLDPCAALHSGFELADGESRRIVFVLGAAQNVETASELARRYAGADAAEVVFGELGRHWEDILGAVRVETPDPAVNVLANGWLLYQILSSRFWARSGYYQSGGAIGFRDQLQDCMSLVHALPQTARRHLLVCAARQFLEGDVLHWWHPPLDRGVRTHCSDDYLWLPLAVARYVRVTGDTGVLLEEVNYLEGRLPGLEEESVYDVPARSELRENLYRHCVRAIEHGLASGPHGLPLMGGGDWNDGMNTVGDKGQGESVWLGFFQSVVLTEFLELARLQGDVGLVQTCGERIAHLRAALEEYGWDGEWYRRAYFDDGTPLGSSGNEECQIDSLAQSWSVLSGVAPDERRRQAMTSLEARLVKRDAGLIQLLDPPFDHSALEPGYIKGYLPGVRENGGQYTHAAIWAIMAFAALGQADKAWDLLALINPVRHGDSGEAVEIYKVEPYVVSADVYTVPGRAGRGGWSWYTGASSWMYRLILESLLGLRVAADRLTVRPLLPQAWDGFTLRYRYGNTRYHIRVVRATEGGPKVTLDGEELPDLSIPLRDSGGERRVEIAWPDAESNAERHPLG